jgi:hypothetical protein
MGALALARSILHAGTNADIVVLHTAGVDASALVPLSDLDCRLVRTELLDTSDASTSAMPAAGCTPMRPLPRAASRLFTRRSTISASSGSGS